MTVQGDQPVPGEQDLAAAGQLHPGLCHRDLGGQPVRRPKPAPMASTCRGRAADSAAIAAGSARGSPPRTAITRAPATRAVVNAASVAAPRSPGCTSSARRPRGAGCLRRGQHRRVGDHADARQRSREHIPATPTASTARGSSALICARSMALTTAPPAPRRGQQQRRVGPQGRPGGVGRSAGRAGLATTTTGDETNNRAQGPRRPYRERRSAPTWRRRQAGPCGQTDMRLLDVPGSTTARRGGSTEATATSTARPRAASQCGVGRGPTARGIREPA